MINKYLANNPFRIVGLTADSKLKDIQKNLNKIKALSKVNRDFSSDFDIDFFKFQDFNINENIIEKVKANLNLDKDKLKFSLFWFVANNTYDNIGLKFLKENNLKKTIQVWKKVTSKEINIENFSTYNNLSTLLFFKNIDKSTNKYSLYVTDESNKEIAESITLKFKLLDSNFFKNFYELISKSNKTISNTEIINFYSEIILKTLQINRDQSEINRLFLSIDSNVISKLNNEKINNLISKISNEIKYSKNARSQDLDDDFEEITLSNNNDSLINKILYSDVKVITKDKVSPNTGKIIKGKEKILIKKGVKLTEVKISLLKQWNINKVIIQKEFDELAVNNKALDIGKNLMNNLKNEILELKKILGNSNLQYQNYADKLADELHECGLQLLNERGNNHEFLSVYNFALLICENYELKSKIRDSIKYTKELKKTEGSGQVLSLLKKYSEKKNNTLSSAKKLLDDCDEFLKIIKSNLGDENEVYITLCSTLVTNVLSTIISYCNTKQDELNNAFETYNRINTGIDSTGFFLSDNLRTKAIDLLRKQSKDLKLVDNILKRLEVLSLNTETKDFLDRNKKVLRSNLALSNRQVREVNQASTRTYSNYSSNTDYDDGSAGWLIWGGIIMFFIMVSQCN